MLGCISPGLAGATSIAPPASQTGAVDSKVELDMWDSINEKLKEFGFPNSRRAGRKARAERGLVGVLSVQGARTRESTTAS
jgi:hypothetical protein